MSLSPLDVGDWSLSPLHVGDLSLGRKNLVMGRVWLRTTLILGVLEAHTWLFSTKNDKHLQSPKVQQLDLHSKSMQLAHGVMFHFP